MSEVLSQVLAAVAFIRDLHVNPLAAVIAIAVIAAWLEQKRARRRTPQFTSAHQGIGASAHLGSPR
jgi:hypothetical protein